MGSPTNNNSDDTNFDSVLELLENFINWWSSLHQSLAETADLRALHAHLDQHKDAAEAWSLEASRHRSIALQLSVCCEILSSTPHFLLLGDPLRDFLQFEIQRSRTFEDCIGDWELRYGKPPCAWQYFGRDKLALLQFELELLTAEY